MKFYVDECLPTEVADMISERRGYRAMHAARDLQLAGRDDEFHVQESRRRKAVLVTSNHRQFKRGFEFLRRHSGVVVLDGGSRPSTEDFLGLIAGMFLVFQYLRIGAKPPLRNDLQERRLILSTERAYLEESTGQRLPIVPIDKDADWSPSPMLTRKRSSRSSVRIGSAEEQAGC